MSILFYFILFLDMHDTKHRPTYLYVLFLLPVQPIYQHSTLLIALWCGITG